MSVSSTEFIPVIESTVFASIEHAKFAVVAIGVQGAASGRYHSEFVGAAELRANTYVASGFVSRDQLDRDGTELDNNDARSAHFVVLERTATGDSLARVVGNMRLVVKSPQAHARLPVEDYYPELFEQDPLPLNSVEVSRLIARHEHPRIQRMLAWPLFVAGYRYVAGSQLGPVYGLLSAALTRQLQGRHVPVTAMASAKRIQAINATKQPVVIDLELLKKLVDNNGEEGANASASWLTYVGLDEAIGEAAS